MKPTCIVRSEAHELCEADPDGARVEIYIKCVHCGEETKYAASGFHGQHVNEISKENDYCDDCENTDCLFRTEKIEVNDLEVIDD